MNQMILLKNRKQRLIFLYVRIIPIFKSNHPARHNFSINDDFIVIWLNLDDSYSSGDINKYISRLQCATQSFESFTDTDDCVDFLTNLTDHKAFLILSGSYIQPLVFIMDDISKLQGIYILDTQNIFNQDNFQQCKKLRGIFNDMKYILNALNQHIHRLTITSLPFSIVSTSTSPNLGQLDQSFMYTQLIKEIILEIEYDSNAKDTFVQYCLDEYKHDAVQSKKLRDFQDSYKCDDAILWYASETFIFSWLNKALRLQDTKTIIKMAFFLRDLHQQIEKGYLRTKSSEKVTVYRGQQMSNDDFEKLKKSTNQVLSFNGFLSTSQQRVVAEAFADNANTISDTMGVLFRMEIDPLVSSVRYVNINKLSGYSPSNEQEILFSMQTIFRIGEMKEIHQYLWEIDLTLINDTDSELQKVADFLRDQLAGVDGWYRMAYLMVYMGKFDDAMEIFNTLSETTGMNDPDMTDVMQMSLVAVAALRCPSAEFQSCALFQLEEAVKHWETTLSPGHPQVATIYLQISTIYAFTGNFDAALQYAKGGLDSLNSLTSVDPYLLVIAYNIVGGLYALKQNNEEARTYLQKALDIRQKSSFSNDPLTSVNYNLLARVHESMMSDDATVFFYLNKTREIQEKFLPSNHIVFGDTYFQLGQLHHSMGNNEAALSCYEKVLEVYHIFLPPNHLACATVCSCIAILYQSIDEHEKALLYSKKALSICETRSTFDYSDSVDLNMNMAMTHTLLDGGKAALPYWKKNT